MLFCLGSPKLDSSGKALQLPIANPFNSHGRVFFAAWLSFFISFLAWYSLPPLLTRTIKIDLLLTESDILNSNIVALAAGLIVRLIAGPLCDIYPPKYVLIGILFVSALPTGLAGVISTVNDLYAIRFLIGISSGSFIPAQVWITRFFAPSVIGTASGLAAGWGDAGVGVTFFVMPAVFETILSTGSTETFAWRFSFVVPALLLVLAGVGCLTLCDNLPKSPLECNKFSTLPLELEKKEKENSKLSRVSSNSDTLCERSRENSKSSTSTVSTSSKSSTLRLLFSLKTLIVVLPYAATFGASLAINSSLSSWYMIKFGWSSNLAGSWAASFGLLNFITRPLGGVLSDLIAKRFSNSKLQARKYLLVTLVILQGIFSIWIGIVDPPDSPTLLVGITFLAIFVEMGNGACYALVPLINPSIVGTLGGFVGAMGNLSGILFSTIFRFSTYDDAFWIMGVCALACGFAAAVIDPNPKLDDREDSLA